MIQSAIRWSFALCAAAVWRVASLLSRATHKPHKQISITPVSTSYIEKVIRGV
jgi:hypothetical protein